ncbi:hypothetical protein D3C81_1374780 [compost metagenome]
MRVTGQVNDGTHADARLLEVDDELRQPVLTVLGRTTGAHQGDHVVGVMGVGGPDLAPAQAPTFRATGGTAAHTGQVRTRVRFAHADAEKRLAGADARQEKILLCIAAELQDQRPALAVGDPVCRHRSTGRQQLLHQHKATERIQSGTAISGGQSQADPAALRQLPTETCIEAGPAARSHTRRNPWQMLGQKSLDLSTKGFCVWRQRGQAKGVEQAAHRAPPLTLPYSVTTHAPPSPRLWAMARRAPSTCRCSAFPRNCWVSS